MDTRNGFPMFVEYQSISRFNDNVIPNQSVTNQVVSFFFFASDLSIGIICICVKNL